MDEKKTHHIIGKIEDFNNRLLECYLRESTPLEATFSWSKEAVPFAKRLEGEYKPIREGDLWGRNWESAWFHITGRVPEEWRGERVVAQIMIKGEGLIFSQDGVPLQGLTSGSVYDPGIKRDLFPLHDACKGAEPVDLWVEMAAHEVFGMQPLNRPFDDRTEARFGQFIATVDRLCLRVFDETLWQFYIDYGFLVSMLKALPREGIRRARIVRALNQAMDIYDKNPSDVQKCCDIIAYEVKKPAGASDLGAVAIGHSHIDTGWLWPVRETIRKSARTFSNQLRLIERYPGYIFGASQPQHYAFVKQHYPALYEQIKEQVRKGTWEVQGGMWVEADCNIISGESMIRQILHGKNFFRDEFGIDVNNLWLPDVFGYSYAMPQILRKSGIDFFLTQKISWSQFNHFPHHTFKWRGIDGTEILTHFPPEDNYNSHMRPETMIQAQQHFAEKDFIDEFIVLFGIGDGGGGAKEEMIERAIRMADCDGCPRIRFATAGEFFEGLRKHEDEVETWVGELYLELHRGTYTTQALVKQGNRRLEHQLRELEFLYSCLPLDRYPLAQFDSLWKTVLLNQFHDILPGSSINLVYKDTHAEHRAALTKCADMRNAAGEMLFESDADSVTLFNTLSVPYTSPVLLSSAWADGAVTDDQGQPVPSQRENNHAVVQVTVPPCSFRTLRKASPSAPTPQKQPASSAALQADILVLENDLIRYEFSEDGTLTRAWDKEANCEAIAPGSAGNVLSLYQDRGNAWDFEFYYEDQRLEVARCTERNRLPGGPVREGIQFKMAVGKSTITQSVIFSRNSKRLDFETTVDWQEYLRMLRVSFPVNVRDELASFDIQYGFARRPTHRNTSWEFAKFEVVGHRFMDLSDRSYGVALLNDCKYGHKVLDNVLDLNLLRSPVSPDPDADKGQIHTFTYSLLPHTGDLIHSDVQAEAAQLNQGILTFEGCKIGQATIPCRIEGEGLSLEVLKKAEKEDFLILRIVECHGTRARGRLIVADPKAVLVETNLMEWTDEQSLKCDQPIEIELKPFEIRTYKLR